MWLLTDFTKENGPTRVVPGSHRSGKHPQDVMEAPEEAHPDEIKLIGTAGTVVVFNSHLWHESYVESQPKRPPKRYQFLVSSPRSACGEISVGLGCSQYENFFPSW